MSRLVTTVEGKPAQLPVQIANNLLAAINPDGTLKSVLQYRVGDSVSVVNGPLSGWLAEVVNAGEGDRLRLLADIMGRMVSVEVAHKDIEKIDI